MLPFQGKKEQLIGTEKITKCRHRAETRIYLGRFSGYYLLRNRGFVGTDQSIFIKSGILHGVETVRGCSWGKLSLDSLRSAGAGPGAVGTRSSSNVQCLSHWNQQRHLQPAPSLSLSQPSRSAGDAPLLQDGESWPWAPAR